VSGISKNRGESLSTFAVACSVGTWGLFPKRRRSARRGRAARPGAAGHPAPIPAPDLALVLRFVLRIALRFVTLAGIDPSNADGAAIDASSIRRHLSRNGGTNEHEAD
jgi:hypothetical protein